MSHIWDPVEANGRERQRSRSTSPEAADLRANMKAIQESLTKSMNTGFQSVVESIRSVCQESVMNVRACPVSASRRTV